MMIQGNANRLGYGIQLKTVQRRQQESGHSHSIHISKIIGNSQTVTVFYNKAHIKVRIVGNHSGSLTKFQKVW